jgi:glycosyltransferase involved in cell wall biosynthesis
MAAGLCRARGAADADVPEPALAILGPPAITRLMYELWQKDREVNARFDLTDPLQRRDYTLWLCRNGAAVGVSRRSIAAAAAILRQGTSLRRPPPRWPPQAARQMTPADRDLAAWLTEPIDWDLGAPPNGIPMPRALALLWELRQDVRLHFPNRTRAEVLDYIGWWLTQGLRDRCVTVELIEAGLADFLDAPDPELLPNLTADDPPITRLLRLSAALYDGPYRDVARLFPHDRKARLAAAISACGALRRRYGWPRSFVARPLAWLMQAAPIADAFAPFCNLALALWELYPELRARCDLQRHEGRAALLAWFVDGGAETFGFDAPSLPPERSPWRAAVRELPRKRGRAAEGLVRRELCLMGYPGLASGRAEDLRMTALALSRHGKRWAVLDRLSGAIATEDGGAAPELAEPPRVNLIHLNADTAFFDHLLLREKGIEKGYTIGYWAWELAKFPAEWTASVAFVDEIWVTSRFTYDAIAPASPKPVFLMPPAVALPPPEPGLGRADFGLPDDKFIFYFSFDLRSYGARKNPLAAVEAFRRAFPQRAAPVILLLKTIGSEWLPDERHHLAEAFQGDPRIVLIDGEFPRPHAIALLALTDCFVSLHRSEGFGRGPAEAMLFGKPVIVTDYSGTCDFATKETALLVDYKLVPVGAEEYPGADGQVWAEPDIEMAAAAMRKIAADSALARRLGNAGRRRIRELYNPVAVGKRYCKRLDMIIKALQ